MSQHNSVGYSLCNRNFPQIFRSFVTMVRRKADTCSLCLFSLFKWSHIIFNFPVYNFSINKCHYSLLFSLENIVDFFHITLYLVVTFD